MSEWLKLPDEVGEWWQWNAKACKMVRLIITNKCEQYGVFIHNFGWTKEMPKIFYARCKSTAPNPPTPKFDTITVTRKKTANSDVKIFTHCGCVGFEFVDDPTFNRTFSVEECWAFEEALQKARLFLMEKNK